MASGLAAPSLHEIMINNSPLIFLPSMQRIPVLSKPSHKEIKPGLQLPSGSRAWNRSSKQLAGPLSLVKWCFLFPFQALVQVSDAELQLP